MLLRARHYHSSRFIGMRNTLSEAKPTSFGVSFAGAYRGVKNTPNNAGADILAMASIRCNLFA